MSKKNSEKQKKIRVIIFGYCSATNMIIKRLQPNVKVVGISDRYSNLTSLANLSYYPLSELKAKEQEYDYIIITERYRIKALETFEMINKIGINKTKIIPYFCYASFERYRVIFENNKNNDIKGLIFGNSHATYGYDTDFLSVSTINLSLPGSDIFDISQTVERVLKEYGDRLKKVSFILMDCWAYNFINIDNSRSNSYIANMVHYGYITERHNYAVNSDKEFIDELKRRQHVFVNNSKIQAVMKKIFGNQGIWDDEEYSEDIVNKKWSVLPKYPLDSIPMAEIIGAGMMEAREDTIEENQKLLKNMIKTIKNFNPNTKIIFTLMPRFNLSQNVFEPFLEKWKPIFENVMTQLIKKYEVILMDYTKCSEIAQERDLFFDWTHLNAAGAAYMTSIVDKDIMDIIN